MVRQNAFLYVCDDQGAVRLPEDGIFVLMAINCDNISKYADHYATKNASYVIITVNQYKKTSVHNVQYAMW